MPRPSIRRLERAVERLQDTENGGPSAAEILDDAATTRHDQKVYVGLDPTSLLPDEARERYDETAEPGAWAYVDDVADLAELPADRLRGLTVPADEAEDADTTAADGDHAEAQDDAGDPQDDATPTPATAPAHSPDDASEAEASAEPSTDTSTASEDTTEPPADGQQSLATYADGAAPPTPEPDDTTDDAPAAERDAPADTPAEDTDTADADPPAEPDATPETLVRKTGRASDQRVGRTGRQRRRGSTTAGGARERFDASHAAFQRAQAREQAQAHLTAGRREAAVRTLERAGLPADADTLDALAADDDADPDDT